MTATSLGVRNIAWNTAVVFGIACVSGAVTWTISKAAHRFFRIRENIMHSPSLVVREVAAVAGGAATYALASRAALASFPVDAQFCKFHCLHLIFGPLFSLYGIILNSKETRTGAMMFGSLGTLLLFSIGGGAGNRVSLFAAGGVGVIMGLRV